MDDDVVSEAGRLPNKHLQAYSDFYYEVIDMGGVGTFTRQNRTLYVGCIKETGVGPETEVMR